METKIKCPIFKQSVTVIYKDNIDYLIKKHNLINTKDSNAFVYKDPIKYRLHVVLKPSKFTLGILLHECVHITNFIFDYIGVNLDVNNDEFQAYYTQFWFEQILNKIDRYEKTNRTPTTR